MKISEYAVTCADNGYIFQQDGRLFVFESVERVAKEFAMVFSTLQPGEKIEITITNNGKQD